MSDKTLNLTGDLYQYLLDTSLREPPVLTELRNKTNAVSNSRMQVSPEQGQFMRLLMQLTGAKRTLEIGVFTGYSTLSVALALPEDGSIIACDVNEEWTSIAKEFWIKAGVFNKIDLKLAPAQDTLDELINSGHENTFDFAFIDADKAGYDTYYEQCLQLVKPGGLIGIDNVLWYGKVIDDQVNDHATNCIRKLNEKLHKDNRVDISLIPIGDGFTLARKKQP